MLTCAELLAAETITADKSLPEAWAVSNSVSVPKQKATNRLTAPPLVLVALPVTRMLETLKTLP